MFLPVKIKTIYVPKVFSDSKVKTTYLGAESAKPKNMKNDKGELMTEAQLIPKAKAANVSVESILKGNWDEFVEVLDNEIKYRSL